jgi:hypothetical protein
VSNSLLNFTSASLLPDVEKVLLSNSVQVLEGCCEFVRECVFIGASGRRCSVDKSICAENCYSDVLVFSRCFLRIRELNQRKKVELGR